MAWNTASVSIGESTKKSTVDRIMTNFGYLSPPNYYSGGVLVGQVNLRTKIFAIGSWNMDTSTSKSVTHGLTYSTIRRVEVMIGRDDGASYVPIHYPHTDDIPSGRYAIATSSIVMIRRTGAQFDGAGYVDTTINRGWVVVDYQEAL